MKREKLYFRVIILILVIISVAVLWDFFLQPGLRHNIKEMPDARVYMLKNYEYGDLEAANKRQIAKIEELINGLEEIDEFPETEPVFGRLCSISLKNKNCTIEYGLYEVNGELYVNYLKKEGTGKNEKWTHKNYKGNIALARSIDDITIGQRTAI